MKDPEDLLEDELESIEVSDDLVDVLNELSYTACETGLTPFVLRGKHDTRTLVQLVRLAEKYPNRAAIPDGLKL